MRLIGYAVVKVRGKPTLGDWFALIYVVSTRKCDELFNTNFLSIQLEQIFCKWSFLNLQGASRLSGKIDKNAPYLQPKNNREM